MREIDYRAYSIHSSDDMLPHYNSDICTDLWPERRKEILTEVFNRRRMFRELLEVWPVVTGLKGYAILDTHGNQIDGQWVYLEGGRILGTIQSFIDSLDGKVAALMILSCNPQNCEISSQQSLVFHSNRSEILPRMVLHSEIIRLYVPGEGYLERDYKKLKRVINRLNGDLK